MRLVKGLFGNEFKNGSDLFGLHCGQMRGSSEVHNGGWYNGNGEKIGWGDLSKSDLNKISKGLKPDEVFIVLGEQDSFWKFVTRYGIIGAMCQVKPDEQEPGVDYVVEHARIAIFPNEVLNFGLFEKSGITRDELKQRLKELP